MSVLILYLWREQEWSGLVARERWVSLDLHCLEDFVAYEDIFDFDPIDRRDYLITFYAFIITSNVSPQQSVIVNKLLFFVISLNIFLYSLLQAIDTK